MGENMIKILWDQENHQALAFDQELCVGKCIFLEKEDTWNIIHTEVDSAYQGKGIAKKLVLCLIQNAKKYQKKLIAQCSYAKKMIENKEGNV